jgi:aspartate dehydrogenase
MSTSNANAKVVPTMDEARVATSGSSKRVGLAGLGAVGRTVAHAIATDLAGYRLGAVAARREGRAREFLAREGLDAPVVSLDQLADHSDVVVEALPSELFRPLAEQVLTQGKQLIVLSAGALLDNWDVVDIADRHDGRILVPSGAMLGLDAVQAAAEGKVESVTMVTRKPTAGLVGAPILEGRDLDLETLTEPVELFRGTAREAIVGFPANLNVAVAVALAGPGPDELHLEVWADPHLERNTHEIVVESDSARLRFSIENVPTEDNPRTGKITGLSVVALLRKLVSPLRIGT